MRFHLFTASYACLRLLTLGSTSDLSAPLLFFCRSHHLCGNNHPSLSERGDHHGCSTNPLPAPAARSSAGPCSPWRRDARQPCYMLPQSRKTRRRPAVGSTTPPAPAACNNAALRAPSDRSGRQPCHMSPQCRKTRRPAVDSTTLPADRDRSRGCKSGAARLSLSCGKSGLADIDFRRPALLCRCACNTSRSRHYGAHDADPRAYSSPGHSVDHLSYYLAGHHGGQGADILCKPAAANRRPLRPAADSPWGPPRTLCRSGSTRGQVAEEG